MSNDKQILKKIQEPENFINIIKLENRLSYENILYRLMSHKFTKKEQTNYELANISYEYRFINYYDTNGMSSTQNIIKNIDYSKNDYRIIRGDFIETKIGSIKDINYDAITNIKLNTVCPAMAYEKIEFIMRVGNNLICSKTVCVTPSEIVNIEFINYPNIMINDPRYKELKIDIYMRTKHHFPTNLKQRFGIDYDIILFHGLTRERIFNGYMMNLFQTKEGVLCVQNGDTTDCRYMTQLYDTVDQEFKCIYKNKENEEDEKEADIEDNEDQDITITI